MADSLEFGDVCLVVRGNLHNGKLRVNKQGVVFKSQKTGKVDQITANDIETIHWLKVAKGYGLKIILKDGTHYRFDGFKESAFDSLSNFVRKNFETELGEIEVAIKGWNWGTARFTGSILSFEVDKKPAFEIPLKDVSQATTGKNEVTIEFHQNDDAQVSLMEMRFYVPSTSDGDDPVKSFQDQIMSKADVIQATGDAIVSFHEIACLTPRGRYSIKVYPTFLQLHGKTYDYKIPHTTCLRLFLLPHKDQRFMYFVISMDPPIRQGQTRYPFLILSFERDEEISVKLNLSDKDIGEKYNGKLKQEMSGPLFEVVSRVLKEIIGRKITVPGTFKGHSGTSSITCSHKAGNGLLYPLERGFIFVHKPPVHVRFDEISCVNFARGSTTGRTFDFDVELKNGTTISFSNIERQDYGNLYDFVTSKNLRIRNKSGKSGANSMMDDLMDSDDESPDFYLEKVKAEAAEDDDEDEDEESEDEDFRPDALEDDVKEEFDSAASSSESEESGSEEKPKKKKEIKRKAEKPRKESSAKKPRKEKASKRQKKDPNAPKRAMPAYMIWLSENREAIKSENPGISIGEISKKAGEKWQQITDKSEWVKKAAQAKENYKIAMAKYLQEQKSEASTTPSKSSSASKSNPIKEALSKSSKPPKPTSTSPSKFKSKEFIESSEDSSSEDEKSKKSSKAANKSSDEEDEESEAQMTDEDESDSD